MVEKVDSPSLTFVGALPPPVTGMTAMTAVVVDALRQRGPVTCFNWSRDKVLAGWRWKAARIFGAAKSVVGLLAGGRAKGAKLYYPVSCGAGLYYDMAIAAVGRLLGYQLVFHHHVYSYIDRRDWRVAVLDRLAGRQGVHVVYCELMRQDFLEKYESRASFWYLSPTIVANDLGKVKHSGNGRSKSDSSFTFGFLSNLTISKGLDDAIATFETLVKEGRDVRLILAGPCMGSEEKSLVDDVLARWPDRVEYRGPIYGQDKAQFYADLDAFLFPTKYRQESWGIVLSESLEAGKPVIARSRGCVRWIVQDGCGLVVPRDGDYVGMAVSQIKAWMDSRQAYDAAREAAVRRAAHMSENASRELTQFVDCALARA